MLTPPNMALNRIRTPAYVIVACCWPFLIWNVPSGVDQELAIYAILLILFSLFTGYLLGFFIRRPKRNQPSGLSLPDSASLALGLERKLNDDFK